MAVQELRFALGLLGSGGSGCECPEGSAAAWPRRCRASVISFTLSRMIDLFGCNDAMSASGVRGPHPGRRCLLVAEWTTSGAASLCGIDSARRWVASAHQQPGRHCPPLFGCSICGRCPGRTSLYDVLRWTDPGRGLVLWGSRWIRSDLLETLILSACRLSSVQTAARSSKFKVQRLLIN